MTANMIANMIVSLFQSVLNGAHHQQSLDPPMLGSVA